MSRHAKLILTLLLASLPAAWPAASHGEADLYRDGKWAALASDHRASAIGDSLTVLIFETATATNTTQAGSRRATRLSGNVSAGDSLAETADLGLNGSFDGAGQTGRSGKIVAQISVVVDAILPNGDLAVSGEQLLNINGERTRLKLRGRVRRIDITAENTVVSARLADVLIDYDGAGFVSRSGKAGPIQKVFSWLGLL